MQLKTLLVAATAALVVAGQTWADWKPGGPVHLQIGFGAGGSTDTLGRAIAAQMEKDTGWDVVAENKPGGGGIAMFTGIAAAPADGLVIGMGVSMPVLVNLVLRGDKLSFDLDSFDYLATVTRAQLAIIAKKDAPFDDMTGLVAHAKKNGGAPIGFDAKPQELILRAINKSHDAGFRPVSAKSGAEDVQNVLGGHVVAAFAAGAHIPYLESGDLKMIASANDGRHSYAPDVSSLKEQGFDLFVDPWWYIAAPKGLPADAREALTAALSKAIQSESVGKVVSNAMKTVVVYRGPDGTRKMMDDGLGGVAKLFGK